MVGSYILVQELAAAGRDHEAALRRYEDRMRELVVKARAIGPSTMATLIPKSGLQVRVLPQMLRLLTRTPPRLQQRLFKLQATPARALDSVRLSGPRTDK
jgi:2-polyprenyl-6-methoxyphenol hydroxylase-like FAD-dependent oxidoreductase